MADLQPHNIAIRLHQTEDHLVLAAPIPGIEPQNIFVVIAKDRVTIRTGKLPHFLRRGHCSYQATLAELIDTA